MPGAVPCRVPRSLMSPPAQPPDRSAMSINPKAVGEDAALILNLTCKTALSVQRFCVPEGLVRVGDQRYFLARGLPRGAALSQATPLIWSEEGGCLSRRLPTDGPCAPVPCTIISPCHGLTAGKGDLHPAGRLIHARLKHPQTFLKLRCTSGSQLYSLSPLLFVIVCVASGPA